VSLFAFKPGVRPIPKIDTRMRLVSQMLGQDMRTVTFIETNR
jgi:hypothetical protein